MRLIEDRGARGVIAVVAHFAPSAVRAPAALVTSAHCPDIRNLRLLPGAGRPCLLPDTRHAWLLPGTRHPWRNEGDRGIRGRVDPHPLLVSRKLLHLVGCARIHLT
jgi:hypothetical protein